MAKNTLHEMTGEQLEHELAVLENDLQKLTFEKAIRGVGDNSQFKKIRHNIARVLTELRKRDLATYTPEDLEMRSRIRARRARAKKA